jgi:ubiquitin C-terminal hydrolase
MNATLQCLSNIEQLTQYFKYGEYIKHIVEYKPHSLTASYKLLIDNLWPSNYKHKGSNIYTPNDFMKKIYSMNENFKPFLPNDARDLLNFIIMTLHEELNKKQYDKLKEYRGGRNEQLSLKDFIDNFCKENRSIISDLFYGAEESMQKCLKCKNSYYLFHCYFFLNFPLEGVRKFKLDELQKNNNIIMNQIEKNSKIQLLNKNIVDIKDCFDYNRKIDIFSGDNAIYCETCKQQNNFAWQTLLYTLPQILIIYLNRGYGNQYKVRLEFNELLNLKDYAKYGGIYELFNIITHLGEGLLSHFVASCKSPIDNKWYRYNDDIISNIYNFKEEILDYGNPYILFYKRKD